MENNKRGLRCLAAAGVLVLIFMAIYPVVRDEAKKRAIREVSLSRENLLAENQDAGEQETGMLGTEGERAGSEAEAGENTEIKTGAPKEGDTGEDFSGRENGVRRQQEIPEIVLALEDQEDMKISLWQNEAGEGYFFLPGFARGKKLVLESIGSGSVWVGEREVCEGDLLKDISEKTAYEFTASDREGNVIWQAPVYFMYSSELPVVSLTTASGEMAFIDEEKTNTEPGSAAFFDEAGELLYEGGAESIRGRGNSTWGLSKKPYQFKLSKKADIFGFGEARSFNLLANGYDETRLRNQIALELAGELGMAYVPEFRMVDLYINDNYYGNYYLTEKIQVGQERVAIRDMEELQDAAYTPQEQTRLAKDQNEEDTRKWVETAYSEEDLTGGYLFERELFSRYQEEVSGFVTTQGDCYAIQSPLYASKEQVNYIADLMQSFQDAVEEEDGIHPVSGKYYSEYVDVASFVQKYLVEEITKNYDGGVTSSFFYKPQDAVSNKIFAGPVWDYDVAFGNCNLDWVASDPEGITKLDDHVYGTDLFARLYEKEDFYEQMRAMYREKALPYLEGLLEEGIDRMVEESRASAQMDSIRWENLENRYQYYEEYDNDVRYLKYFIAKRMDYLNRVWLEEEVWHEVAFMVNGEIWQIVHVKDGEVPGQEPVPVSYTPALFMGWYTEKGVPYDRYKPAYEDMVFHALWQELDPEDTVSDGG